MNKKVCGIVIGIFFICIGIFGEGRNRYGVAMKKCIIPTGTLSAKMDSPKTRNSAIGVDVKKGDKLKFEYSSKVREGDLKIKLCYHNKVIESFDINVNGKKEVTVDEDMDLILWAEQKNFKGYFKVEVYK